MDSKMPFSAQSELFELLSTEHEEKIKYDLKFLKSGRCLIMKNKYKTRNKKAMNMVGPDKQGQGKYDSELDQAINDIRLRAEYVGSVLEGIIQAHPCRSS